MKSFAVVLCLALVYGVLPRQAVTQPLEMSGRYAVDLEASDDVRVAIEAAVTGMNFLTRPIARNRLRRTNPVGEIVVISLNEGRVRVAFDQSPPMDSPDDGTLVKWGREDREQFDLSTTWEGDALVQTFGADEGTRTGRFALSEGGRTLRLNVTVHSPHLPRPLEYELVYRRSG